MQLGGPIQRCGTEVKNAWRPYKGSAVRSMVHVFPDFSLIVLIVLAVHIGRNAILSRTLPKTCSVSYNDPVTLKHP